MRRGRRAFAAKGGAKKSGGFIVLDTLVAFAILALGLGSILVGIAVAERAQTREAGMRAALRLARTLLAESGETITDTAAGQEPDGTQWSVDFERLAPGGPQPSPQRPLTAPASLRPVWVRVSVHMREGGSLALATLKLEEPRGR